jgi:hypothetical protein
LSASCRRNLGTIRLIGDSKSSEFDTYFLADETEITLFDFASAILTSQEPKITFKQALVESKKVNIARLSLWHIGIILKRRVFNTQSPTKEIDTWLLGFWAYCTGVYGLTVD